jgi:competence protein ComEA
VPPIGRPQLLVYAALALVVAVLGARALRADGGDAAGAPTAVVDGGSAAPGSTEGPPAGPGGPPTQPPPGAGGAPGAGGDAAAPAARELLVHVAGAVTRPGVYRVIDGARVQDAVELAGGARRGADVHALNLAAKVSDGQQILVPRRGRRAGTGAGAPAAPAGAAGTAPGAAGGVPAGTSPGALGGTVNLNTASIAELETLDGVGPAIAQKIVAWREANGGFRSVEDLAQVAGIGPKKLEAVRARVGI